jgi:hypothetical protein
MLKSTAACLSALVSIIIIMGDMSKKEELLLCVLPFPEPADIIAQIRENHPHFRVVYRQINFTEFKSPIDVADAVPEGK